MTIYIYEAEGYKNNVYNLVDSFEAETNQECEDWADENYGDTDFYRWSYTEV